MPLFTNYPYSFVITETSFVWWLSLFYNEGGVEKGEIVAWIWNKIMFNFNMVADCYTIKLPISLCNVGTDVFFML